MSYNINLIAQQTDARLRDAPPKSKLPGDISYSICQKSKEFFIRLNSCSECVKLIPHLQNDTLKYQFGQPLVLFGLSIASGCIQGSIKFELYRYMTTFL
jgi:hypothetical protein